MNRKVQVLFYLYKEWAPTQIFQMVLVTSTCSQKFSRMRAKNHLTNGFLFFDKVGSRKSCHGPTHENIYKKVEVNKTIRKIYVRLDAHPCFILAIFTSKGKTLLK